MKYNNILFLFLAFTLTSIFANASKLMSFKVVDNQYLMLLFYDGEVKFVDDGKGTGAFTNLRTKSETNNYVETYGSPLDLEKAVLPASYTITSTDDENFGTDGQNPIACHRKSKINGMAEKGWIENVPYNDFGDYDYKYTYQHWIFVKLPQPMQSGKSYTIEMNSATQTDTETITFTYDEFNCRSEAVHVNLVGYTNTKTIKAADVYLWMGDGGARDFSAYQNNKVYVYNVETKDTVEAGKLTFWKTSNTESGYYDYIKAKVWNADFTGFNTPGTYRLVVEGIGCSEDFEIAEAVHYHPFAVSVQGFYYMRAGEDSTANKAILVPRRPLWIPNESPKNCKVLITTMHPYHNNWHSFASGDKWDKPDKWAAYVKPGNPENPNAYGGHVDALDWDRHLGHVSIIYDMLLPFVLTNGVIDDDNTGIAESENGIPDILDEARNEVDFWLRLRDGMGYSHGVTNPNGQNILYQAGTTRVAAYVNAANSAMLAECFRITGNMDLMSLYRDSAIVAYNYANTLTSQSMDTKLGIGEDQMPASDLKMMAAAYLYNITGDTKYEDVVKNLSKVTEATSQVNKRDHWNQLYATVAYLLTNRDVHYPELYINMKKSLIYQANEMEAKWCDLRATRRANANNHGYYPTVQNVQRTIVAHAIANDKNTKRKFLDALILEADWSLGRNPANMIQMTTATTELADKRSVQNIYTNGRDDGVPGLNPGHTPYFNIHDWACSMIMGCPGNLLKRNYPENQNLWPQAELFYNTRYVWAHTEFTPQQTMRGKMALYGYLHGVEKIRINNSNIPTKGIWLENDTIRLFPDNQKKIDVTILPANASDKNVIWITQDETVAAVNNNGNITAVAADTTKIIVSTVDGRFSDSCIVIVRSIEVPVSGVAIEKDTLQLYKGKTIKLLATVMPGNASDTSLIWYSQQPDIVEIDKSGQIEAKNEGATYVFVETVNEHKTDSCFIKIRSIPELICHLDFQELTDGMFKDQTGNQHNGSANGEIKFVSGRIGQAITLDGADDYVEIKHSDDFQWNLENSYSISVWVLVDKLQNNWTGLVTKSRDISPWSGLWISPDNKWHSANAIFESAQNVIEKRWYHVVIVQNTEISQHKLYIDGELKETGSPVAQTDVGDIWIGGAKTTSEFFEGKIDELRIYAIALSEDKIKSIYNQGLVKDAEVTNIRLEPQQETIELTVGETYQFTAVIEPENAINQNVTWKSDNSSIASVDQNGKITALSNGTAKITVADSKGDQEAFCNVNVTGGSSGFNLTGENINIKIYPNPAKNDINIDLDEVEYELNYVVYNFTGKIVMEGILNQQKNRISVNKLIAGLYVIEIQGIRKEKFVKFVKQK